MKASSIFLIICISALGLLLLGANIFGYEYNWNKELMQEHNMNNSIGNIFLQAGLLMIGVLFGFVIFTPRGKTEFTKYDFIKPKGDIKP